MKIKCALFGALFVIGCNAPQLSLSDNTASNVAAIQSHVPTRTDASMAIELMSDEGFTCNIERNAKFTVSKGTSPVGVAGPMDFVWCDKQKGSPVARRWQVILVLDKEDKVKEHSVTTGLVGP